nr:MAG TPA: hypothetical protein [Caudoviricetes sp.]
MFAVFCKSKKKEFENSFNKLGVKIKDEEKSFAKDTGCYQISGDFSSEKIAMDFVELCKGREDFIRPVFIAILKPKVDKYGNEKLDKKTGKPSMRYYKHRELPK